MQQKFLALIVLSCLAAVSFCLQGARSLAKVELLPGAVVDGSAQEVQEIFAAFALADEAVRTRDLRAVMNLYSKAYRYHRLGRSDVRKIWERLFANYDQISSVHLFERVRIVHSSGGSTAEIRCTGNLTAVPKGGAEPVNLDSWFGQVYYMIKEGGVWRIRGNEGDPPVVLEFGTDWILAGPAAHPLF